MRGLELEVVLEPPDPDLAAVMRSLSWSAHRCRKDRRTQHINIQELEEVVEEVREAVRRSLAPERLVNGVGSGVTLGAWAKGRSSSRQLSRRLRRVLGS